MRLSLGFPERSAERALLAGEGLRAGDLLPLLAPADLLELQQRAAAQHAGEALLDYVLDLVELSRQPGFGAPPLSPRAAQALLAAARAWSLLEGRGFVTPADVQAVLAAVVDHRTEGMAEGAPVSSRLLAGVDAVR
jgi:MoxR-like ATPase